MIILIASCVKFLAEQAQEIGIDFIIVELIPKAEAVVCMTWTGSNPDLPSLMLNSHMDVVPVDLVLKSFKTF
jgi:aminoacylase